MKLIKTLAFLFIAGLFIVSCQKEYSEENGGASSNATGTLKASGSGECLPSSVQGVYIAGTALTASNYINVTVDITALGAYTITTDVVNGYSFSASGVATTLGTQTIKLVGSGTPTADGNNTFTVKFGTSQCNIVVQVYPVGTGNAVFSNVDCAGAVLAGTYQQGTATNAGNTVQVEVTVTTAGLYNITTNSQNGVSFSGSGFLAVGTHMVTLTANGGTPTNSGTVTYTVTAGTGTCNFDITYASGPVTGGNNWSFTIGSTTRTGSCDDAQLIDLFGIQSLIITGDETTGTGTLMLTFVNPTGAIGTGSYSGTSMTGRLLQFQYSDGTTTFSASPGTGTNLGATIDVLNTTTHVAQGKFSGTARQGDPSTGTIVTVTNGTFKANLP